MEDYTIYNELDDLRKTVDELISRNLSSIDESGILTIGTDWFMNRINVDTSMFDHMKYELVYDLDRFKRIEEVDDDLVELVLRCIRIRQVPTEAFIEECLDEAVQLNVENLTEYYSVSLTEALRYYGLGPEDIQAIHWL